MLNPQDLGEALVNDEDMEDDDPMRFKEARNGDHLMCIFLCDNCHFYNIQSRAPIVSDPQDELLLLCIRRANLDAFWARERSTVEGNRKSCVSFLELSTTLGIRHGLPPNGPWPKQDVHGMRVATTLLMRSLSPGKNAQHVQFQTVRKLRFTLANYYHTSPTGLGVSFVGDDGSTARVSHSVTNSPWFKRFMLGMHKRMGDVWIPDRAVTLAEVHSIFSLLEDDWNTFEGDTRGRYDVALSAVMTLAGFFGGLRGEEITRVDVSSLLHHWREAITFAGAPHVPLMLAGRFKREIGEKLFCQPLAPVTKSGIRIQLWFERLLIVLRTARVTRGPLFRVSGRVPGTHKRASVGDLDAMFHPLLRRVQEVWPSVIPDEVKIEEAYSVGRSLRRGSTSAAQNAGIPKEVIEANNRWRKHVRARGLLPGMTMMERYSDAKASVPTLIRYSQGL